MLQLKGAIDRIDAEFGYSSPRFAAPENEYAKALQKRAPDELHEIAQVKRFLETWSADPELRQLFYEDHLSCLDYDRLKIKYGISIPLNELVPVLKPMPDEESMDLTQYPLALRWLAYMREMYYLRGTMLNNGFSKGHNQGFDIWRARQVYRLHGEIGLNAQVHTHPAIAFELCDGCSVGCWFCGISAAKFRGHWPYSENQQVWRDILDETISLLGPAAATGFCYWGTDPTDNPDYEKFIIDFFSKTGVLPQTTTAIPLKNVDATRRLMAIHAVLGRAPNRFSVLTRKYLDKVHGEFSADELLRTELVIQIPTSNIAKVVAGRALDRHKLKSDLVVEDATIACVSGFLVNMPHRRVQLITPTRATPEMPDGFYILGERHFETAADYGHAISELASEHMTTDLKASDRLAFRPDVKLMMREQGLQLSCKAGTQTINGPFGRLIAQALGDGKSTTVRALLEKNVAEGNDLSGMGALLTRLFQGGLFLEQAMRFPGTQANG